MTMENLRAKQGCSKDTGPDIIPVLDPTGGLWEDGLLGRSDVPVSDVELPLSGDMWI
jgi:hypothetical protein